MPSSPLVSVLITNYNYGSLLGEAIDSALAQTYSNVEVVVVDDGSTDESRDVMARYGERIVGVVKENGGQGSAFNAAFAASRGEVLCFLDSDDVFFPDKVQRVVDLFDRYPDVAWIRNGMTITDGALRPLMRSTPEGTPSGVVRAKPDTCLEDKVRFVVCSGMSVRRSIARRFLPIDEAHVAEWRYCADAYVGFWCAVEGACYQLHESLGCYRRQDHQRYLSDEDIVLWLQRQIRLEERLSRMWSERTARRQVGSDVYKHSMVVDALRGSPIWSVARSTGLLRGLRAVARIALARPTLASRQGLALVLAFVAPRVWVKRLRRELGLPSPPASSPTGFTPGARRAMPANSIRNYS